MGGLIINPGRFGGGPLVQSKSAPPILTNDPPDITATFDDTPIEGNLLIGVLCLRIFEPQYTLTVPATWFQAVQLNTAWAGADSDIVIFYKVAGSSEATDVVFTLGNDNATVNAAVTLHIMEWADMATSSPLDVVASNDQTSGTSSVATTGDTAMTAVATSLAIAACAFGDDDYDAMSSGNWSDGYTLQRSEVINAGGIDLTIGIGFKMLSATGIQSASLTLVNGGDEERFSAIAVFKGA